MADDLLDAEYVDEENIHWSINWDHHCMFYVETPAFHKITLVRIVPASWALTSTEDIPRLQKSVDKKD